MSASPNSWRKIRDDFAEETGVDGLHLLKSGLSKIEAVFWIVCILFLGILTSRDLANLSATFMRQDTVTLAHQVVEPVIVFDPSPTLAFHHDINVDTFSFELLENDTNVESMIDTFLNDLANSNNNNNDSFSMPPMDELLFELTAIMVQTMLKQESAIPFVPTPMLNITSVENASAATREWKETRSALIAKTIERCYDYYRQRDANFSSLMRLVASKICEKLEFTSTHSEWPNEDAVSFPCAPTNIVFMDSKYVIIKVMNHSIKFGAFLDYLRIAWKAEAKANKSHLNTLQNVFFDVTGTSLSYMEPGDSDAVVRTSYTTRNQRVVVSARISAAFTKVQDKSSDPCSTQELRYDCKQRCYAIAYVNLCNCWSLYFSISFQRQHNISECAYVGLKRSIPSALTNASLIGYMSWCTTQDLIEYDTSIKSCHQTCLQNCYTKAFVTVVDRAALYNKYESDHYELELNVRSFVYPLFEERLEMSWEDFFSQFGGTLGLYLGISFAALIHIPVFGVRVLVKWWSGRRKPTAAEEGSDESSLELHNKAKRYELSDIHDRLIVVEGHIQRLLIATPSTSYKHTKHL